MSSKGTKRSFRRLIVLVVKAEYRFSSLTFSCVVSSSSSSAGAVSSDHSLRVFPPRKNLSYPVPR